MCIGKDDISVDIGSYKTQAGHLWSYINFVLLTIFKSENINQQIKYSRISMVWGWLW